MRKIGVCLLILTMIAGYLTGCCRKDDPPEQTEPEIIGVIHDTGEFRLLVPEPWRVFPITDPFAEGRPVKTDCVFLRKGGESDWKVTEKPYIRIEYYGPDRQMEEPIPDADLCRNVEELPPMQLGDLVWNGYTADDYQGRARIGRFAILWTENGDHKYQVFVWFESGGEFISLEDRDLQAILASVTNATQ